MRSILKALSLVMVVLAAIVVAACDNQATTTASCAFIVGSGQSTYDAKLHSIVYPGQSVHVSSGEVISYFPCNSRNFIINDGSVRNANGQVVGDRSQLIKATTSTGVAITVAARALWTLNQSEVAMRDFYAVCFKYKCASAKDQSGDTNFSTPGWNGMLAENFGTAMDTAARNAAIKVDDSIWKQHNPTQYKSLGDQMSAVFADVMRANLGYPEDLFCGSGNSAWSDPNKPGSGTFTCTPVRIVVDDVQAVSDQSDTSSQGALAILQTRRLNAEALYGTNAGYWLGVLDSIEACKQAGVTCIVSVGGSTGPTVSVPLTSPTPSPTPSSTAKP